MFFIVDRLGPLNTSKIFSWSLQTSSAGHHHQKLFGTFFTGGKYGTRLSYASIAVNTTMNPYTLSFEKGLQIYEAWEMFVNEEVRIVI